MSDGNEALGLLPHNELVQKMARDLYFGNGKPALTVRMALQEESMLTVEKNITEIKESHKQATRLIIGTLVSSIGGMLMMGIEIYLHSGK